MWLLVRKQAIKVKALDLGRKKGNAKANTHHDMPLTLFIIAHCSLLILSVILCKMYSIHARENRACVTVLHIKSDNIEICAFWSHS